jgi:hypothetical protein
MAVPHYTYLVLKIPGPNGIITAEPETKKPQVQSSDPKEATGEEEKTSAT